MKKFNVGDIVKANVDHPNFPSYYDVTNKYALCKVVESDCDEEMRVEVIYHTEKPSKVGRKYYVTSKYFDLVISAYTKVKAKEMTVAEIEKELGYSIKVVKE